MMRAVASIVPLVLAAAVAAAPSTKITICTAEQCMASTSNISVGAVVSMDGKSATYIILPGTYDQASSPSELHDALSGGASRIAMPVGFEVTGDPPVVSLQPGIVATSASLYRGPVRFEAAREPGQLLGEVNVSSQGSVLVAQNVWATFRRQQDDSHVVVWDSIPDMSQLPESLKGSDMSPVDIQSTGCAAMCSANGVCAPDGTCKCAPGFEGDSCEICKPGFYGSKCAACPEGCAKCSDGLAGTGVCLEPVKPDPSVCSCMHGSCNPDGTCDCFDGWRDDPNGSQFKCSSCDDGFYLIPSTGECKACGVGCSSCAMTSGVCMQCEESFISDASDLTRCRRREFNTEGRVGNCPPGRYVLDGLCQAALPNGACNENATRIANVATGGCEPCPSGCVTCEVNGFLDQGNTFSKTQCTTCLPGMVLVDGTCEERCPSGRFISPQDGFSCLPCDSSCSECFGDAKTCYKCPNNQLASNGSCVSSCPEGSVPNNGFCSPCHADCATCTGTAFDTCTSCHADRPVLQGTGTGAFAVGRCLPTCNRDEFFDAGSGKCQTCHASCSSCSGPGANNCLACSSPRQTLAAGSCVDAACTGAMSVVQGLGVCLSALVEAPYVPNDPALSSSSDSSTSTTEAGTLSLPWWQILLMVLGGVFILSLCLILWRIRMRKRRAAETAAFATKINTRNMFWRGASWLSERLFGHRGRGDPVGAPHMQQHARSGSQGGMPIVQHLGGSPQVRRLSSETVGTRGGPESVGDDLWQTPAHTGASPQPPQVASHLTGASNADPWPVNGHPIIATAAPNASNNPFRH